MRPSFFLLLLLTVIASCKLSENIQDGQTAYNLKKYSLAAELLQKDFNKQDPSTDHAAIAFKIAQSYKFTNNIPAAEKWFETAIEWEYGSEAILELARMLKIQEKYTEAIQQFNNYLKEEPYRRPEINVEINACENALSWMKAQQDEYEKDMIVIPVTALNSGAADFQPAFRGEGQIVFTSSRSSAMGDAKDSWTGGQYFDLFTANTSYPGKFSTIEPLDLAVNTPYNDGSAAFNADASEMFFTRCGTDNRKVDDYCGIFYSYRQPDDSWSEPVELPFFEDSLNLGSPCLSPDGQLLFFVATEENGYGGSDIYFSQRLFDGWSEPENAGSNINTAGNEAFPSFGPDGTFYFSSDGLPGMGGLDIFSAKWSNKQFSRVNNMEYPINSGADDFGILIDDRPLRSGEDTLAIGYFSSSRKGGAGNDDIYMFIKTPKKPRPPVFILAGNIQQKTYEDPEDVTSPPVDTIVLPGSVAVIGIEGELQLLGKYPLKEDTSTFRLQVDKGPAFKITASAEGFFTRSVNVESAEWTADAGDTLVVFTSIVLDRIPDDEGVQIKLSNIYYDYNDTTLRPESFPELDQLVALLNENPGLIIQISSHTDARGQLKYNQRLSQGRANSVVVYLIEKGINPERLVAKGFGEEVPDEFKVAVTTPGGVTIPKGTKLTEQFINTFKSNKEDFEFLHQFNRRTTFNVLSDDFRLDSETPENIEVDEAPDDAGFRDETPKID